MRAPAALLALCGACLLLTAHAQNLDSVVSLDHAPDGFSTSQTQRTFPSLIAAGSITTNNSAIMRLRHASWFAFMYEIPFNDPLVAPAPGLTQFSPDQIHVQLGDEGSIWVSWATGTYQNATFPPNTPADTYPTGVYDPTYADPASVASVVQYGIIPGVYKHAATGMTRAYIQTYIHNQATFISQLFHHVNVRDLPFGVPIYYKVGDPSKEMSEEFVITLKTSLAPNKKYTYPLVLGVVADVGQTLNSSQTYEHLVADNPDAVLFIGDLAYADDYNDKGGEAAVQGGVANPTTPALKYGSSGATLGQTWQPRWDSMARLLQRSGNATAIPYNFCPGNHEIERDEYLRTFQSYTNRFRHSYEASYSTNPLYYSTNIGPVHSIMLNSYDSYLPNTTLDQTSAFLSAVAPYNSLLLFGNSGSAGFSGTGGPSFPNGNYIYSALGADQLSWLLNDLARVDRSVTPWVTVSWHQPPYNSYTTHYKEAECLRQMVEPFLYNFGVDVVFHGHVHAYERNYQTLNYKLQGCAPRWITMGDGGNQEGLYSFFAGEACAAGNTACATPVFSGGGNTLSPVPGSVTNPAGCITYQNGSYAPINAAQPPYSAYREPSFGHAIMTVYNETTALWQWKRNLDGQPVVTDSVYFIRNPACSNYGNTQAAPAPKKIDHLLQPLYDAGSTLKETIDSTLHG